MTPGPVGPDHDTDEPESVGRLIRLERAFVRVRWAGLVLAVYLLRESMTGPPPRPPGWAVAVGLGIIGGLAVANVVTTLVLRRITSVGAARRLGAGVFAVDSIALLGFTWSASYDPVSATWVILYLLPLEGAIRFALAGALVPVGVALVTESLRELYLSRRFPSYPFEASAIAFRVGVMFLVGLVSGITTRALRAEAANARRRASLAMEAAERERVARSEISLLHSAVVAGLETVELEASMQSMAERIATDLRMEICVILLAEGDVLRVSGGHGLPPGAERRTVRTGEGVTGAVAASGKALLVPDVGAFPGYLMIDPEIRAEAAVPLMVEGRVIGVLDVETADPSHLDQATFDLLARLADHIALVVRSGQLLAAQREVVDRLLEVDQMKSDFVAITSHELRTPIAAIRGFARTLSANRDALSAEEWHEFVDRLDRRTGLLSRLVENLLLVSQIEDGAAWTVTEPTDLGRVVDEALELLSAEDRARVDVDVDVREPVVTDPGRLGLVLQNVLGNALKFSTPGSPVQVTAATADGMLRLSVEDRGPGIPPDQLPHIFDRFRQGQRAMRRETDGVGLGLYITRRLVRILGGTVEVRSEVGAGTVFSVKLPVGEAPGAAPVEIVAVPVPEPADD